MFFVCTRVPAQRRQIMVKCKPSYLFGINDLLPTDFYTVVQKKKNSTVGAQTAMAILANIENAKMF